MKVRTWQDVLDKLSTLTPEQLKQPIQCVKPTANLGEVQDMLPGIAIATVEELGFFACRSTHNNKYCAGDVVLLIDENPFGVDGTVAYNLSDDWEPIYDKDGPTPSEAQFAPQQNNDYPAYLIELINSRVDSL